MRLGRQRATHYVTRDVMYSFSLAEVGWDWIPYDIFIEDRTV